MKRLIITIALFVSFALNSLGEEKTYFKEFSQTPSVGYTYVSPEMLAAMGECTINSKNMSFSTSNVKSLEKIEVFADDNVKRQVMKVANKIIKKEKLTTLASESRTDMHSVTIMGRMDQKKKTVSCLLHIETTHLGVNITYIKGDIPLNGFSIAY